MYNLVIQHLDTVPGAHHGKCPPWCPSPILPIPPPHHSGNHHLLRKSIFKQKPYYRKNVHKIKTQLHNLRIQRSRRGYKLCLKYCFLKGEHKASNVLDTVIKIKASIAIKINKINKLPMLLLLLLLLFIKVTSGNLCLSQ